MKPCFEVPVICCCVVLLLWCTTWFLVLPITVHNYFLYLFVITSCITIYHVLRSLIESSIKLIHNNWRRWTGFSVHREIGTVLRRRQEVGGFSSSSWAPKLHTLAICWHLISQPQRAIYDELETEAGDHRRDSTSGLGSEWLKILLNIPAQKWSPWYVE